MKTTTRIGHYNLSALLSKHVPLIARENEDEDEKKKEADKAFDVEFSKRFNKAMKDQKERIVREVTGAMSTVIAEAFKARDEAQAKLQEEQEKNGGGDKKKGGEGGGGLSPEVERRIKAAEESAAKAKQQVEEAEKRAKEAQDKQLRNEELSEVTKGLIARKAKEKLVPIVAKDLAGRVVRDDQGNILWKKGDDDFCSLDEGLNEYMKSDIGKELIPARDVGGGGNRGPGGKPAPKGSESKMDFSVLGSRISGQGNS